MSGLIQADGIILIKNLQKVVQYIFRQGKIMSKCSLVKSGVFEERDFCLVQLVGTSIFKFLGLF